MFGFGKKKQEAVETEIQKSVILSDMDFHKKIDKTLNDIEEVLIKSYGPLGSNTLINKRNDNPILTKDGFTILKNLNFYDPIESDIHRLIFKISQNLVTKVGDGSTSAVLNAIALYQELSPYMETFSNRKDFISILNIIGELVDNRIVATYKHIVNDDNKNRVIESIAKIANNNDVSLGNQIATIFKSIPAASNIKLVEDPNDNPGIRSQISYGFTFPATLATAAYLGKNPSLTANNCQIFTSYEFFEDHYNKLKSMIDREKYTIVITEICDQATVSNAVIDFLKGDEKIIIVKTHSLGVESSRLEFIDLAIYLDSNLCNLDEYEASMLGSCRQVDIYNNKVVFIGGAGIANNTEIFMNRIESLSKEYEETPDNSPATKGMLKLRLDKLNGVNVTLFIGGRTEEEKKNILFLVEDSVNAIKSSIENGFTLAGNVIPYYATRDVAYLFEHIMESEPKLMTLNNRYDVDLVESILGSVVDAFFYTATRDIVINDKDELKKVLESIELSRPDRPLIYNKVDQRLETIENTMVIAPVETDREIIKASFSIVTLLLSINQAIVF